MSSEPAGNGMTRVHLAEGEVRAQALVADSLIGSPNQDAILQKLMDVQRERLARAAAIVAPGTTP